MGRSATFQMIVSLPLSMLRSIKGNSQTGSQEEEEQSDALDDHGGDHARTDAQSDNTGREVAALKLVDQRCQKHRAGSSERVTQRDRAAVDVDLAVIDVESLHE